MSNFDRQGGTMPFMPVSLHKNSVGGNRRYSGPIEDGIVVITVPPERRLIVFKALTSPEHVASDWSLSFREPGTRFEIRWNGEWVRFIVLESGELVKLVDEAPFRDLKLATRQSEVV